MYYRAYHLSLVIVKKGGQVKFLYLTRDESESVIVTDGHWLGLEILWKCVDYSNAVVSTENIPNTISYVINNSVRRNVMKKILIS